MTRVLLDTCVLYPTFLRQVLRGAMDAGFLAPLWSERIFEEWRRATARQAAVDAALVDAEIALLKARYPAAMVDPPDALLDGLHLPDANDRHVLAAAIAGDAAELLTLNTRDFPTRALAPHGILRRAPDEFLLELYHANPEEIKDIVDLALQDARPRLGPDTSARSLLKRASLPRLGKALYA